MTTPAPARGSSICFAGTGALGLEALSRSADFALFVEDETLRRAR